MGSRGGTVVEVVNGAHVVAWVAKRLRGAFAPTAVGIGLKKDELIAGVIYENWNHRSVTCHIAISGRMTPIYLAAIFHYPFKYLGVDKIICPVSQGNDESRKLVENMGFKEEARLKDAHPEGDIILYTMTLDQCRFIGERYENRLIVRECHGQGFASSAAAA